MGELRGPERDARRYAERVWGDGVFKEHAVGGQAFHRRGLAKGVAVEVAGRGALLVCHDYEDVGAVGHGVLSRLFYVATDDMALLNISDVLGRMIRGSTCSPLLSVSRT